MKTEPKFSTMGERPSRALLRRNHVGRLAFTFRDRVDIEPIGYVLDGPWLYGRTSRGTKLVQLKRNPWVAFEVDEVEGPFDWRSVVVKGTVYFLNPGGEEHPAFQRALTLFRRHDTRALRADDPVPHRTIVFRIYINELTGMRAASPSARESLTNTRVGATARPRGG